MSLRVYTPLREERVTHHPAAALGASRSTVFSLFAEQAARTVTASPCRISSTNSPIVNWMRKLLPRRSHAATTRIIGAQFLNGFGSTENGLPPATADLIPSGAMPETFSKRLRSLCELRLLDSDGRESLEQLALEASP